MTTAPAVTAVTDDADATRRLAGAVAGLLDAGDTVALSGDLGAGKTCFVQGAAAALGVDAPVTSPTFVLVKLYHGDLRVVHADVYRLNRLQDVWGLGDDLFAPDAVTFLEWGDAVQAVLPPDRLDVELVHADDPAATATPEPGLAAEESLPRRVRIVPHGGWTDRRDEVVAACAPWCEEG